MVPRVERLQAQLEIQSLREGKVFEDADVPVVDTGHGDGVAPAIPEFVGCGLSEGCGIEPFFQAFLEPAVIPDFVGSVQSKRVQQAGSVASQNGHREALLEGYHARDLPAANEQVQSLTG